MKRREMLKATSAAVLGLSAFPLGWTAAAEKKKQKVLYYTRSINYEHSPVHREGDQLSHSEKVLTALGKRAGFDVVCSKDGRVFDGDLDQYDLIASYSCGDQTRPSRRNTPAMTPEGKQKLLDAIAAGKGFVGFHSAADTFHSKGPRNEIQTEVDPYVAMLGGEFVKHGRQQKASLIIASRFPGAGSLGCAEGISLTEEWYALKNFAKDLHVILVQETKSMKGDCYQRPDFPCTWARMHGKGRVFYTSFGHREDIWTNPFVQAIVLGGIAWALGNVKAKVEPNIDRVTPKANQLLSTDASEDKAAKDRTSLQGVWNAVSISVGPKKMAKREVGLDKIVIKGNKLDGLGAELTLKLDPTQSPKAIDLIRKTDKKVWKGIYTFEKDELTLCLAMVTEGADEEQRRPKNFGEGPPYTMIIKAKREKSPAPSSPKKSR